MIKNWFHLFVFNLKQNKLFTALNVLGLSMGMAGLIFAILYWNDEQSYDQWNTEKDKVFVSINQVAHGEYWSTNVVPLGNYLKKDFPEVDTYFYFDNWYNSENVRYGNRKEIFKIIDAQQPFFACFPFHFIHGTAQSAIKDASCIALSDKAAQKLFGAENPMGKQVIYGGKQLTVNGVYSIPGKSSMAPEAVTHLIENRMDSDKDNWGNFSYGLMIKLKNPTDKDKVIAHIGQLMYQNRVIKWAKEEGITPEEWLKKNGGDTFKTILQPLSEVRLHAIAECMAEGKGNYQFLLIMVGLSVLILVLSIVNYVNMATASAIKRAKEVGVRKIIGASKGNIIAQFIFETSLITAFSLMLSLVLVELSLPYYNEFLGKELIIYGSQFYLQLLSVFVFTIAVAGVFPAVYVSNFETLKVLKGNFGRSKSGVWLRNSMLVLQFSIATFFIIGSYIVYEQVQYISTRDLGFKGDQVIVIDYRNKYDWHDPNYQIKLLNRYQMVKAELSKIKGVEQVASGAFNFGTANGSTSSFAYHNNNIQGRNMGVDFGMLEMMQIQLKQGRFLSDKIASDTINSMLINETTLKMMHEPNPIGKTIDWNGNKLKIIGVVKDFNLFSPQEEIPPMVFFHFKTIDWMINNVNKMHVKISSENPEQTIDDIRKFWVKNVDTEYPFVYDFVSKSYARTYENYVKQRNLFSLLNLIVILIALFGLFALATFSIQRRMKEIAIRKTLGADTSVLLKTLSKQYIVFCLTGFALALFPVYYLLNRWLDNFAFRIEISMVPFVVGFVVLLVLTLLVVLSRAYHATRVDVLQYLKYE